MTGAGVAELVRAAGEGSQRAWDELVDRYSGLVWAVCRAHRLSDADAADVSQTAWLRLVEHLGRVRDPERVGAWLATTTRHECLRVLRRSGRQVPTADEGDLDRSVEDAVDTAVDALVAGKRADVVRRALDTASERCRALLRLLLADPPPSYEEIGAALDMPIGSIGPTRARCLERLRATMTAAGITAAAGDST